jgi:hypothetical protein
MNYDNSSKMGSDLSAKIVELLETRRDENFRKSQSAVDPQAHAYEQGSYHALKYVLYEIERLVKEAHA